MAKVEGKPEMQVECKPARKRQIQDSATKWPADQVERRQVADLVPYARNARKHSAQQVGKIAASIREFGWTIPVLVDEADGIIAGHGRIMAAQKLGIEDVPVMVARGWSEHQKRAYVIADNKLTLEGEWDEDLLRIELGELAESDFSVELTGFDEKELARILQGEISGNIDPDEVPDIPENPVTLEGDVWILGRHRLICGDSTKPEVVEKVLAGVQPHLMVTDPPYGVEYDASWRKNAGIAKAGAFGKVLNDDNADWREAWALFYGEVAYVWHAGVRSASVAASLESAGFSIRSQIIWNKSTFAIGRSDYHWQHEPCWYAVRKGKSGHWNGDRKQTTVWDIDKPRKSETGHSTQKPVECMQRPIENNSSLGQAVYEPFAGSGTTIIAAHGTGRHCLAVELSPAYVDVCILRWQEFAGETAVLEETGETFAEVQVRRQPDKVIGSKTSEKTQPAHAKKKTVADEDEAPDSAHDQTELPLDQDG